ncbi:MAG: histidine kinase dimerization/phosphoacceptor domain -containing protein, partial [Marinoscillum sp.]
MKVRLGILGLYFTLNLYAQSPSPFVSREDQNAQASSEIVEHLLDTLSFAELEKDTSKIIHTTNKLVIRYALMKNFDRAADLAKQNLELAVKYDNQCLLGQTYNHLAIYLGSNKVYEKVTNQPLPGFFKWADSAIYYFRKSTEVLVDDQCELNPVGWGYAGMMRQYFFKARMSHKQFDTALYYAEKARLNAEKYDDLELLQGYNVWTARCYNHMGQYELAKAHIRQAYEIAIERNRDFRGIYDIWFGTLVKEAGNDSLLWLHHEIVERNQNLAGAEMQMAIQNADRKYETSKKEQELRTKDQQLETRERIIGIGVISLILILSLSLYLFLLYKKNQKLSKRNELLLKEQNHRVKNNLQMISSLLSLQSQKLLSVDAKDALNNSQL